jgi:predicted transcriptional regulator
MSSITIKLSDEQSLRLQEAAARFGLSPEDLVRVSLEDLLARPEEDFQAAVEYVLNKNEELYHRLA